MKIFLDTANIAEIKKGLLYHPLTANGMERFLKDWEKVKL